MRERVGLRATQNLDTECVVFTNKMEGHCRRWKTKFKQSGKFVLKELFVSFENQVRWIPDGQSRQSSSDGCWRQFATYAGAQGLFVCGGRVVFDWSKTAARTGQKQSRNSDGQ